MTFLLRYNRAPFQLSAGLNKRSVMLSLPDTLDLAKLSSYRLAPPVIHHCVGRHTP